MSSHKQNINTSGLFRLDAYLTKFAVGSRSEVKTYIKSGRIRVNGVVITKPEIKVTAGADTVCFDDREITFTQYTYVILNKPKGYITASTDPKQPTVMQLIKPLPTKDLQPVGRLDKDTEGLLLFTDDGALAHRLLSPKSHVEKVYLATVRMPLPTDVFEAFEKGIILDGGETCLPAHLRILSQDTHTAQTELTICEGKYHQVKRMFEAVGSEVLALKRIRFGSLILPDTLASGAFRVLTKEETEGLHA